MIIPENSLQYLTKPYSQKSKDDETHSFNYWI